MDTCGKIDKSKIFYSQQGEDCWYIEILLIYTQMMEYF